MYLTFVIRILGVLGTFGFLFVLSREYSFEIVGQFTRLTVTSAFTSMLSRYSTEFLMDRYRIKNTFMIPRKLVFRLGIYHLLFTLIGIIALSIYSHVNGNVIVNYLMLTSGLSLMSYNFQIYSLCGRSEVAAAINLASLQLLLIPLLLLRLDYLYIVTSFCFLSLLIPLFMLFGKIGFSKEDYIFWPWLSGISITIVPYILGSGILFYVTWILDDNMLGQLGIIHKFFVLFLIVSQILYSRSLSVSSKNWATEYDRISRKPGLALLFFLSISYPILRRVFEFDEGLFSWYIICIVAGFCFLVIGPSANFAVLQKKEDRLVLINWLSILIIVIISFCYSILGNLILYTCLLLLGLLYRWIVKKVFL